MDQYKTRIERQPEYHINEILEDCHAADPYCSAEMVQSCLLNQSSPKFQSWVYENHFDLYRLYRHTVSIVHNTGLEIKRSIDFPTFCILLGKMSTTTVYSKRSHHTALSFDAESDLHASWS